MPPFDERFYNSPTINLEDPDNDFNLDLTPNKSKPKNVDYSMSNSFGFGGTNVSLIFKNLVKYLFSFILFINISFYLSLMFVPLNQTYTFSISEGDSLKKIFKNLEYEDIYFPRVVKIMINIFGIDKKLSQGSYVVTPRTLYLKYSGS